MVIPFVKELRDHAAAVNAAADLIEGKKPVQSVGQKRTMSISARRKIAAAQRKRWAKVRRAA